MKVWTPAEAVETTVLLTLAGLRLGEPDPAEAPLVPAELRRAQTFALPAAKRRYLASRQAARRFVAVLAGVEPSAVAADYHCPECGDASAQSHGVPHYLARGISVPFQVSFSRSGDWLLAAAADTAGPLGVDLADLNAFGDPGLDTVIATDTERAALDAGAPGGRALKQARLWTRKEAALKAAGDGLRIAPHLIDVSGNSTVVGPARERVTLVDLDIETLGFPAGLLAAAAVPADAEVRIAQAGWA